METDTPRVPDWVIKATFSTMMVIAIGVGGFSLKMQIGTARDVSVLAHAAATDRARIEVVEKFVNQGPRVTPSDLDARVNVLSDSYKAITSRILETQNQILSIQRQQSEIIARMDERIKNTERDTIGHENRLDRLEQRQP